MAAVLYILALTLVGLNFNGTYSIFNTLARTPPGEAGMANAHNILKVSGVFDAKGWLGSESGESGFVIENVSQNKIWVYFEVRGDLGKAIEHINPVCIKAGEKFKLSLAVTGVDELGLLGWRNNNRIFAGVITARILNSYAEYEIGSVKLEGSQLYEKMLQGRDGYDGKTGLLNSIGGSDGEIGLLKSLGDIVNLIALKISLTEERDQLLVERDRLTKLNEKLALEKKDLEEQVNSLQNHISSLSDSLKNARDLISSWGRPEPSPALEPEADSPEGGVEKGGDDGADSGEPEGAGNVNEAADNDGSGQDGGKDSPDTSGSSSDSGGQEGTGSQSGDPGGNDTDSSGEGQGSDSDQ